MDKEKLLIKYKKVWDKIDAISKQTDSIVRTSGMGQAPPVFHRLVEKQVEIINKKALPIWEELKSVIRNRITFETYWQYTNWSSGATPPHYNELGESV